MREKLLLAATLTFSLYLFVEVSASVKTPSAFRRSLFGSAEAVKTLPHNSLLRLPNWYQSVNTALK